MMISYALKSVLFWSTFVGASALSTRKIDIEQSTDGVLAKRFGGLSPRAYRSSSASVSAEVMVQGWASLATAANQCQSVFQQHASVEVAVKAAVEFSTQVENVNNLYGRCACDSSSSGQFADQYRETITKFLVEFQLILQSGERQYAQEWNNQFAAVFQRCSPAFVNIKTITASLRIDLSAVLAQAHVDANLFAKVGLNLSVLLGLNLHIGIGGLISL
ncbi:hypothetical protein PCASD_19566 [Puccinia coronata f. sp. avenae]|uniref:Pectinesterase inhibitor domain-containing protein n=1 Tax=Puccinia coronata f. sp. avenae TaxID=200324 RepID=A0A2N5SNE3_9BASI|nr:hypothetical protein PCASD_19566 [Puccinia coronata f. sp. avenae]